MTYLLGHNFSAVLDFINLTTARTRIKHDHIKLANGKLQHKNLFFRIGQLGFQQNNVLHHPPLDLIQNTFLHGISLCQRQRAERLIQQQAVNQGASLCISKPWLCNHGSAALLIDIRQVENVDFLRQIQQFQIFSDFSHMRSIQLDRLFRLIANFQQLSQIFRYGIHIHPIQNIRRILSVATQVVCGDTQVVRFEIPCQNLQRKTMIDILNHAVNGTGQLVFFIQVVQMAEMSFVLIAA